MSKIALGTVQFGIDYGINSENGQVQPEEVRSILNYAHSQNIDLLDTAPAYGNSEKVLGAANVQNFKVVTKTRHFDNAEISNDDIDLLKKSYEMANGARFTDDASVVASRGHEVHLIEGFHQNIKITTGEDLDLARLFLSKDLA